MSPQVLIVGSGPTGLIAALTLLKSGVSVRIVEKETTHHVSSKGCGLYHRMQEIEHFLGTYPDVLAQSTPAIILHYYDPENPHRLLKSVPMAEPMEAQPGFPISTPIMISQYLHEAILRAHVEALGGRIELGTALSDIEHNEDGVVARLTRNVDGKQETELATFSYIMGADGGRGTVRKLLGLQFLGETREAEVLLNADIDLKGIDGAGFNMFGDPTSIVVGLRSTNVPERYQLLIFGTKYFEIAQECLGAGLEELQSILRRLTGRSDLQVTKIHTKTDWRLNVRMVNHFQKGRVFVAGDAAHVHSPMGGQGMSSGIQDAFNLAWKLALVVKGHASPALLTSYEEERLPVIGDMLLESEKLHRKVYPIADGHDAAHNIQSRMDALEKAAAPLTRTSGGSGKDSQESETLFRSRKLFQLELNYRWSSIVLDERFAEGVSESEKNAYGTLGSTVRAGDRAPDAPGLVVLSNNTALGKVGKVEGKQGESVRFFDIFNPSMHSVLVFSTDTALFLELGRVLKRLPANLVQTLLIVPSTNALPSVVGPRADLVLEDKEGHAYRGYGYGVDDSAKIVVVRPDGMIGAFAKGSGGVEGYFTEVLGSA
ncbi:hypothetical protein M0805_008220 [Coniferiporia weirii]|nr:hypothetical protein M0805_008220 [Coniferiporia weirii]